MKKRENPSLSNVEKNKKVDSLAVGNRVKSARMLSGLTRKAFAEKSNISAATLRIWEEPNENRKGLTNKGVKRFVLALGVCGVHCSEEWLLTGRGIGPKLLATNQGSVFENQEHSKLWSEEEAVLKDIDAFIQNNPDAVIAMITDNAMAPFFTAGDYVAGAKKYGEAIKNLIGLNCIIELSDKTLVRRISSVAENGYFTLTAINHETNVDQPVITNINIRSAAEIVWHRWKQRQKN